MLNTQEKIIAQNASAEQIKAHTDTLSAPIVFTNGCFDILHRGHATYLEQARNLGAALIVGVNSDDSVRRQGKGDDRPINPLIDRMSVLASLACVDAVVSFEEDTPFNLISTIMPQHLVKGGDWAINDIIGGDIVNDHGGQVHSIPFKFDRSTTSLLKKIRML